MGPPQPPYTGYPPPPGPAPTVIITNQNIGAQHSYGPADPLQFGRSPSSNLVALLLCIFLGLLGVHRFYVGKIGSGIAQLILSITYIGLIVSGIWVFIDFIVICCGKFEDSHDRVLSW
jgi:hypothetical protein